MKNKILIAMIVVSMLIGASTLRRGHEWGDDWAWYILQAQSIADGTLDEFLVLSDFTNYQSTTHLGPLAYPWGYPLILLPFYVLNGISPLTLKIPALLFFAGFLLVLYWFTKRRFTPTESLILVSLFAFNPLLLLFLDQILSDIPFLFFSTLTLILALQPNKTRLQLALLGLTIFCTAFLRATGVFLLGAFLAIQFFAFIAQRKALAALKQIIVDSFVVCTTFAALWIVNLLVFPGGGGESYLSQYANLNMGQVLGFINAYFKVYGWFFGEEPAWQYLYYVVLVFALIGAWLRRKDELFLHMFFVIWMLVHITYPYWQGPRYIFPLLPIFIYFAFEGMKFAVSKLPAANQVWGQRAFYGFWLAISVYFLYTSSSMAINNLQNNREINGPFDPYSMEVYDWVERKTEPDSVLIFYKARVMRLMTSHPSIMINECDGMLKGDYLILSKKVERNNQVPVSEIGSCNLPLDKEFENRRFVIYRIEK